MSKASYHGGKKPVVNENLKREAVAGIPRVGRKAYAPCDVPRLKCAIDRRYQTQKRKAKKREKDGK